MLKLEDDHYCFACGALNDSGLKLQFALDKKNSTVTTEFIPQKKHQGYKDIVHGGIIGLILDECMVNAAWKLDKYAVTAEYTIKLLKPAKIGEKLIFCGKIANEHGKLLLISGNCRDEKGNQIAIGSAKCIKIKQH